MYANQNYDQDCITWSPKGRLLQVEYAMKAEQMGEPVVGIRSDTAVVLCAFLAQTPLAEPQQKIFHIDSNLAVGIAGLTFDGRLLCEHMRMECINHQYTYDTSVNIGRLCRQVADKAQAKTAGSGKRPYGVGLMVAGFDETGPRLIHICPSGAYFEYHAHAIGARTTSARTKLENDAVMPRYMGGGVVEESTLMAVATEALNQTVSGDVTLSTSNTRMVVINAAGVRAVTGEELDGYLKELPAKKEGDADAAPDGDVEMEAAAES